MDRKALRRQLSLDIQELFHLNVRMVTGERYLRGERNQLEAVVESRIALLFFGTAEKENEYSVLYSE